jgi:hypothetical protein
MRDAASPPLCSDTQLEVRGGCDLARAGELAAAQRHFTPSG